jgi:hypothetical protein
MQMFFIHRHRQFISAENNFGVECHQTHPRHALFVFGHHTNGFIFIAVNLESLLGCQIKKREHVATRNRRDESLFGINVHWIRVGHGHNGWRRRCWNDETTIKRPGVFPRILALEKIGAGSLPFDRRFVFRHNIRRWRRKSFQSFSFPIVRVPMFAKTNSIKFIVSIFPIDSEKF